MDIDKIIMHRINAMENDLKQVLELLFDVYSQKNLISYGVKRRRTKK